MFTELFPILSTRDLRRALGFYRDLLDGTVTGNEMDMRDDDDARVRKPVEGALFDLLMAVMDSLRVWSTAAGDRRLGLA